MAVLSSALPGEEPFSTRALLRHCNDFEPDANVVVRLYHESRGAHSYFLKQGSLESDGESLVNQIHYDDAVGNVNRARMIKPLCFGVTSCASSRFCLTQPHTWGLSTPLKFHS